MNDYRSYEIHLWWSSSPLDDWGLQKLTDAEIQFEFCMNTYKAMWSVMPSCLAPRVKKIFHIDPTAGRWQSAIPPDIAINLRCWKHVKKTVCFLEWMALLSRVFYSTCSTCCGLVGLTSGLCPGSYRPMIQIALHGTRLGEWLQKLLEMVDELLETRDTFSYLRTVSLTHWLVHVGFDVTHVSHS